MLEAHAEDDVSHLESDHRWASETEQWLQDQFDVFTGCEHLPSQVHIQQFAERAQALARFYRTHIEHENDQLFPLALQVLNHDQIRELGTLMRKHRRIEIHTIADEA
jgi:hemerythrin-like domain-containing protein